ncbi:hypothetical protein PF010_g6989 [Phytophthora fragariae]|uniref:Uncharacterized protein n=1 Tax=Phytophthora fragariae TaxID=53985 RepID=A0A6A3UJA8_9STRA|nr:hypothetical protein PF011_g7314 [Phytophthora fragariae]KAE9121724.1 hypothetical protein PF010_g6989 [Phytophthora fragariae]KAE9147127.1 hypothetical protein PF006_g8167 [Phytophthora fragariae]KAE9241452.1 hypothetical protein PF002_g9259 [Phytophthora fragariae]KAE9315740.1 hypothetical protein PF001_g7642 [Phytophthora fragariae]
MENKDAGVLDAHWWKKLGQVLVVGEVQPSINVHSAPTATASSSSQSSRDQGLLAGHSSQPSTMPRVLFRTLGWGRVRCGVDG